LLKIGAKKMAVRVARGLFRLWLVLSALWIGGVGVETWQTFPVYEFILPSEAPDYRPPKPDEFDVNDFDKWVQARAATQRREALWMAALKSLAPPVLILALGSALIWAFRGFR
jgi:hypothetical protein